MNNLIPIRVGLLDDDCCALKWNSELLMRDLRTTVVFELEKPWQLPGVLRNHPHTQVLLLDTEYFPDSPDLGTLIKQVRQDQPGLAVICLSQYGEVNLIRSAISAGVKGFLIKSDIQLAIASAIVRSLDSDFIFSAGVAQKIHNEKLDKENHGERIPTWFPHPALTPRLCQVFTLRILYGMSAPHAASELHLAPATIEKYMQYVYQRLLGDWADDRYLAGLDLNHLSHEIQAFHYYSLPPRKNVDYG